jgi:hypothetical protein
MPFGSLEGETANLSGELANLFGKAQQALVETSVSAGEAAAD